MKRKITPYLEADCRHIPMLFHWRQYESIYIRSVTQIKYIKMLMLSFKKRATNRLFVLALIQITTLGVRFVWIYRFYVHRTSTRTNMNKNVLRYRCLRFYFHYIQRSDIPLFISCHWILSVLRWRGCDNDSVAGILFVVLSYLVTLFSRFL